MDIFKILLSFFQKLSTRQIKQQEQSVEIQIEDKNNVEIITKIGTAMELQVVRFSSQKDSTLGLLMNKISEGLSFLCFTIEDEYQTKKIYNETRIPAGKYKIALRTEGGFHEKYLAKFGINFHKGMLWIQNVPGFEYILIHIGNNDDDTAGCLLVGNNSQQNITEDGFIGGSTEAYKRIYPLISDAILKNQEVFIEYVDFDVKKDNL